MGATVKASEFTDASQRQLNEFTNLESKWGVPLPKTQHQTMSQSKIGHCIDVRVPIINNVTVTRTDNRISKYAYAATSVLDESLYAEYETIFGRIGMDHLPNAKEQEFWTKKSLKNKLGIQNKWLIEDDIDQLRRGQPVNF